MQAAEVKMSRLLELIAEAPGCRVERARGLPSLRDGDVLPDDPKDDITDRWYIVARGGREEAISIDCSPSRAGRCYDSFWDRHGVVGDCRVVARSFGELLRRRFSGSAGGRRARRAPA